ncbi:MAG: hypothetical protein GXO59_01395 [Dictyoglomi bacterium]|nr:hypothetical protein [Dictyoglomota bacterium]
MTVYRWGRPDSLIVGSLVIWIIRRFFHRKLSRYVVAGIYMALDILGWYILPGMGLFVRGPFIVSPLIDTVFSYLFWLLMVYCVEVFIDWEFFILVMVGLVIRKLWWGGNILIAMVGAVVFYYAVSYALGVEYDKKRLGDEDEAIADNDGNFIA